MDTDWRNKERMLLQQGATAVVERSDYYCCRSKERAVPQAIENTAVTCYYMHDAVRSLTARHSTPTFSTHLVWTLPPTL